MTKLNYGIFTDGSISMIISDDNDDILWNGCFSTISEGFAFIFDNFGDDIDAFYNDGFYDLNNERLDFAPRGAAIN